VPLGISTPPVKQGCKAEILEAARSALLVIGLPKRGQRLLEQRRRFLSARDERKVGAVHGRVRETPRIACLEVVPALVEL
jgi:hypothetical protein